MAYTNKISIIVEAVVRGAKAKLQEVTRSVQDMGRTSGQALAGVEAKTKGFMGSLSSLESAAAIGLGLIGSHYVKMAAEAVVSMARMAAKNLDLQASYENLSSRYNLASQELLDALDKAAKGTVDKFSLMLEANKAMRLGVATTVEEFEQLMKIAMVRAKEFGYTTQQAWGFLVTAIGRASPLVADNIGILLDANATYEEHARLLGKTANQLDVLEKKEAIRNRILAEGLPDLETWNEMSDTAANKFQRLDVAVKDLHQSVGEFTAGPLADLADELAKLPTILDQVGYLMGLVNVQQREMIKLRAQMTRGGDLTAQFQPLWDTSEIEKGLRLYALQDAIVKDVNYRMRIQAQTATDWGMKLHDAGIKTLGVANAQKDLGDGIQKATKELSDASKAWSDYYADVAEAGWSFTARMDDLNFRHVQAAEQAAFRIAEIERGYQWDRDTALRRANHDYQMALRQHHQTIERINQDHYDTLADMEWDHQQDKQDLLSRAHWWIRQPLQKEFTERERIAATGDKKALRDYDAYLLERIRAIDPVYAEELDRLQEQYDHQREIEERERGQSLDRANDSWQNQLDDQRWALREQLRQLERRLQDQRRAWEFSNQQRLENERRAMDELTRDHNHRLDTMKSSLVAKLEDQQRVWEHFGYVHGISYIAKLNEGLSGGVNIPTVPTPTTPPVPPRPPVPPWTPSLQGGAWNIPYTMPAMLHSGEMVVPAGPAERIREGGGMVNLTIENMIFQGYSPDMGRQVVEQIEAELGKDYRWRAA